jgi:predicted dehydrogenase
MYQRSYRVGLIGHTGRGNFGHGLDLAFHGLPQVEVVAVADPDAEGRARAQERSGAPRSYASYQELLEVERPDVIGMCTRWPDQHEAMVTAAVRAGVRGIYSEKPLAPAPDIADRILATIDSKHTKVTVAHHNRVRAAAPYARTLVQEGKIGRLRALRAVGKCDARSGGEDMLVLGSHLMDLMRYYAGDARWCSARVTAGGHDARLEDARPARREDLGPLLGDDVMATFGFDGGVTGTFESMPAADGGGNDYFHFELSGTAGQLAFFSNPETPVWFLPRPYAVPGAVETWQALVPPPAANAPAAAPPPPGASGFYESNRALAADLLEAIEQDRPPINDAHNAAAALEMIVGVYASHLAGARVALPLTTRTHPLSRSVIRAVGD